jgi:hypothetical protein
MTKPVADWNLFMGNRWANMGSFMGNFNYKQLHKVVQISINS